MALTAKKVYAILKRQISDMEAKIKTPIIYRGTVATADLLPLNPDIGDMYNIESKSIYGEAGMNVAWNGVVWDTMGAPIDMSLYIKSNELADWVKQQNKPTYTAEEVGALPADTKIPSKTSDLQNDSGFLTKIPDNYLSGTDKTLNVSGKAADAKATGDKITELSADISNKLNKNQGSENSGKIAGINESGDIVPMFPVSVDYSEETNCLEFGSDQKMELNKGINLDSTLTKTGYAADAGAVGEITDSLKADISNKITKFYASSQGKTHLADSDNGKIQDMIIYGKSSQDGVPTPESPVEIKSVVNPTVKVCGKNLLKPTLQTTTQNGVTCTNNGDGTYTLNGTASVNTIFLIVQEGTNISNGTYKVTGCPSGGSSEKYYIRCGSEFVAAWNDNGDGCTAIISNGRMVYRIVVVAGVTVNNLLFKPMLTTDLTATYDDFEPYHGQTVTIPYTLNAIPVNSGGNVTIDGQQYIADYVDVERGKLVKMVDSSKLDNTQSIVDKTEWLLAEPQEIDLTPEEIAAFKALATYYPTTNISVNSEQLDGYTVFNYPINMANGWNYVKQQIGDTREHIYDIDARTQDTDLQAAEAYVNSEYAVALTELEV